MSVRHFSVSAESRGNWNNQLLQTKMSLGVTTKVISIQTPIPIAFPSPTSSSLKFVLSCKMSRQRFILTNCHKPQPYTYSTPPTASEYDDSIVGDDVEFLVKFKSRHNYIRVLEVSRSADHPLAGSRLLLLDAPGNIHSISFLFKTLTNTYFDVFATLPPILPSGPLGILGFGAGSAARIILELYPEVVIHGWELDPSVIDVGREYFGLAKLERQHSDRLFVYIGNAFSASLRDGFSGILVDLFSDGRVVPELEDSTTWEKLSKCLRKGGRIMVNVGGSCVEAENKGLKGEVIMEKTLKAMQNVFGDKLRVLNLSNEKKDSSVALTGDMPDMAAWKQALKRPLRSYVDMWKPISSLSCNKVDHLTNCIDMYISANALHWPMEHCQDVIKSVYSISLGQYLMKEELMSLVYIGDTVHELEIYLHPSNFGCCSTG